ncbi:hypothetical protein HPC49_05380 [Pyxidicoccus fallax]|uniref:Uncharacterized protein n=1 Tax=Pyxidicoccus fallax TaxID=394095 RepID=A0A848L7X7_9BACT|nr:poly-gamma-glutamate biosynthesis protein PgsC/CapC [Pyxidicoccus fallax]NMO14724.1 hypothetical protein [Pyxidicoccus fallax]NPC77685.1 hypothetical protein [Pyxidicoccus fallax]
MALLSTLTLFPAYSLDTSILAAVLVGVLILALLTETFGWVFVGLVVPGYLASVFVIHPEAGITVVVEAVLTYALALALSAGMSRTGAWSEFFGRDRFFAIVLSSVLVRALSEAVLLPHVGRWIDARWGTSFALDRSLHSIGLVLVPLTANAFWKLKLRRGLWQVGVPVVLTYALLRFVLLPATNLSFSSLELMYEDVAQDFLASPKAYIILLTTALLAARFNLNYGWDFNGILVPALLALTWLEPAKLVATLLEVALLVLGTKALLATPGLRTLNLEGPRKTVLVFFLGFVVKWCIGWALGGRVPGLKVTDLFGFGYLVPTLLAVKILQKQAAARVMLATVHTSLAGFVVGSLVGFGLSLVEPRPATALPTATPQAQAPGLGLDKSPLGVMTLAHVTARENNASGVPLRRRNGELRQYASLWRAAGAWLQTGDADAQRVVRERAEALGLELRALPDTAPGAPKRFALVEKERVEGKLGWDTAVLVPGAPGPVLEVPRPLTEAPSAEAAATLCERVKCRAIIASGVDTSRAGLRPGDALMEGDTPLHSAHTVLSSVERIQVRADAALARGKALLHVPAGEKSPALEALWPGIQHTEAEPPEPGLAWGDDRLSVLRAHPHDLATLALEGAPELAAPLTQTELRAALLSPRESAPYAEGAAPRPTDAELLVLEEQVAAPLLGNAGATVPEPLRARWASVMAGLLGMTVRPVEGCAEGGSCWWVADAEGQHGRAGASLLVRPGGGPLAFDVPVPDREQGTLAVALEAWQEARARALVVATPGASVDILHPATQGHLRTTFQAFHQAVHRALPEEAGLVLQVRGYSGRPAVNADVLVDVGGPVLRPEQRPADLERLLAKSGALGWLSSRVRYNDGSPELAGLSDASPQAAFSRTFGGARIATLWLSEPLRGAFVGPRLVASELALAGLTKPAPVEGSPLQALLTPGLTVAAKPAPTALQERFAALSARAERYLVQQNVHELRMLARSGRAGPVTQSVRAGYSAAHGLPWLMVEARQGRHVLRGVYFLQQHPSHLKRVELVPGVEGLEAAVEQALRHRRPVVLTGELASSEGRR